MAPRNPHPNTSGLKPGPNPKAHRPKGSKNKLTKERVEQELRYIALSDPIALFERFIDPVTGKPQRTYTLKQIHAMPEEMRRCIASVKVRTENLTAGDGSQDTTVEIKLWEKTKALELCARALGMLKDHVVIEGLDDRKQRLRVALAKPVRDDA